MTEVYAPLSGEAKNHFIIKLPTGLINGGNRSLVVSTGPCLMVMTTMGDPSASKRLCNSCAYTVLANLEQPPWRFILNSFKIEIKIKLTVTHEGRYQSVEKSLVNIIHVSKTSLFC